MLYIEQIPRKAGEPFYSTESDSTEEAQKWCTLNCDTSKRHVISKARFGNVIAEGLQIPAHHGYNSWTRKPTFKTLDRVRATCEGYKVFQTEGDAMVHYLESKKEAMRTLDGHLAEVEAALIVLEGKGINFDAWATCSDDQGLECGLGVSCTVNGFYFHKQV